MKAWSPCLIAAMFLPLAGCGKYQYVPVSGRVTMDGKPLAQVQVQFQPVGGTLKKPNLGRGSLAVTDADGKFSLRVDGKQSGAVPGQHRVAISRQVAQVEMVPSKFNRESTLKFEVPPDGTDSADFDLRSR